MNNFMNLHRSLGSITISLHLTQIPIARNSTRNITNKPEPTFSYINFHIYFALQNRPFKHTLKIYEHPVHYIQQNFFLVRNNHVTYNASEAFERVSKRTVHQEAVSISHDDEEGKGFEMIASAARLPLASVTPQVTPSVDRL